MRSTISCADCSIRMARVGSRGSGAKCRQGGSQGSVLGYRFSVLSLGYPEGCTCRCAESAIVVYAGLRQITAVLWTDPGGRRVGAGVVWADEYSARATSRGHRVSREEHDVLFPAG